MASYENERLKEDLEMLAVYVQEKEEELEMQRKEHANALEQLEELLQQKDEELAQWRGGQGGLGPAPPDPSAGALRPRTPEALQGEEEGKAAALADLEAYNAELEDMIEILEREAKARAAERARAEGEAASLAHQLAELSEVLAVAEERLAAAEADAAAARAQAAAAAAAGVVAG
eukprot:CAMPEP_0194692344 /NCGR_PEP_ID=MMETSP0295-20121207/19706_1 /TAXON_ID=39354 /ORGANISM="Heterosigma akashiwo, Strain CCMP2393" /LENGTH=174 /DNA_ID=CAMNT_0039582669 /DNA_START=41 /DNA_END=561 /DNA_ORIENTATION=+